MITDSIDQLIDRSAGLDEHKRDYRVTARDLTFDGNHLVFDANPLPYDDSSMRSSFLRAGVVDEPQQALSLGDHARSQLYDKLGPVHFGRGSNKSLPADFIDRFEASLRATILERIASKSQSTWKIRAFDDTCRAILDGNYPRIWNTDVLRQLRRVLDDNDRRGTYGNAGLHLERSYVDADEMIVRFWWDGSGTGSYRVGAAFTNGETGNRMFTGLPMIQRTTCQNSIITSEISKLTGQPAGFKIVHYAGVSAESLMVQFYAQLPNLLNASALLINRMIEAEGQRLPDLRSILDGLAVQYGWKPWMLETVDEGTEGERTVAGLVNGLTYAAHTASGLSSTEQAELEVIGGNTLFADPREFARLAEQGRTRKRIRA